MLRYFLLSICLLLSPLTFATCNDDANTARLENRIEESIEILRVCLNEELSKVARTYLLMGLAQYEQGKHRNAIQDYTRAIETAPDYVTAYVNRGLSHSMKGSYKQALADFDKALQLDPEYMQAYYFRAFAHEKKRKFDLAIKDYNRALLHVDETSELATIYHHRGLAYRGKGDNELAIADYKQALQINPEYINAYF